MVAKTRIKCLFIIFSILLFLNLFSLSVSSESVTATGMVRLYIINDPPNISSVNLLPAVAYEDDEVSCSADVKDEHPQFSTFKYRWFLDGVEVSSDPTLKGVVLKGGGLVKCEITVFDDVMQSDTMSSIPVEVLPIPTSTKIAKTALAVMGVDSKASVLVAEQEKGALAITGFAVREVRNTPNASSQATLIIVILILVLSNLYFLVRFILIRRHNKAKVLSHV